MNQDYLIDQFDQWALSYDQELETATDRFPFAGYFQVLSTVLEQARVRSGLAVLDLGVGTGNLSRLFVQAGCQVLGVDFSPEMLAKARAKLPEVELVQADLTSVEWPRALNRRFDRITSNYLFHEFPLPVKIDILIRLAENYLADDGIIVIGDIMFPTTADLQQVRIEAGDEWEEEYYWICDETREILESSGWFVKDIQLSFCAGVLVLEPPVNVTFPS